jgi:hypothetical protein
MELALNLVWLAITVCVFAALIRWMTLQPAGPVSRRRQRIVTMMAVALAALLFPIISITDDLAQDVLLADASVARRSAHGSSHHGRIVTAVAMAVISAPVLSFDLTSRVLATVECFVVIERGILLSLSVRAPPVRAR